MPKSVVVLDPVAVNRIRLASVLEAGRYAVTTVATTAELASLTAEPDIVVMGVVGDPPHRAVAEALASLGRPEVPLLVQDADPSPLRRLAALRAGAREVLPRDIPDAFLLARLRGLIREGEAQRECARRRLTAASFGLSEAAKAFDVQARVAVIDPDGALPRLPAMLAGTSCFRAVPLTETDALSDEAGPADAAAYVLVPGSGPDVIERLLPELRDRSHSRHCPVMVIHPADRPDIATHSLDLGAAELAAETATVEEMTLRIEAMLARKRNRDLLRRTDEQSCRFAVTDALTGLYNRRYADAYLADLLMRADETGFIVLLIDLDHFKDVNDRFGHPSGDAVLREVSYRLRDNLRACDLISRHGGEEFLAILPDTDLAVAAGTAERLRGAVATAPVVLSSGARVPVTASIGVAEGRITVAMRQKKTGTFDTAEADLSPIQQVLEAADVALYRAKQSGRNRVEISA